MKDCPKCEMTVAAHCECPVCKNDITDIPYSYSKGEVYKFNKYFLPYFFKKCGFFAFCLVVILLKIMFFGMVVNKFFFLSLALLILTLAESLFPERIKSSMEWKYSDFYIDLIPSSFGMYAYGIFAIIFVFLW